MPTKKSPAPKKARKKPTPAAPSPATPGGFGPPDWGNVLPPPIELIPTGDPKIDAALLAVFAGTADGKTEKIANKATDEQVIGMFRGNALVPGKPFHDQALVDALTPAQKRQRNKVYWAAESAKNQREHVVNWFCLRLARTPAGCAYLLDIAAGDHAGRVRELAANALRDSEPDDALWRQIGERLDPANWIGRPLASLRQAYTVGATGALVADPEAAYRRWLPLLDPSAVSASELAEQQAAAIVLGIREYVGEILTSPSQEEGDGVPERDATPCLPFIPHLVALVGTPRLDHYALFALERLPPDPRVIAAAAARVQPGATYFGQSEVRLVSRTSDPTYLPWLVRALGASWMNWPPVFDGLANIGDPRGIAVIEHWLAANDASDRRGPAKKAIATIRAKGGAPTPEQRAEAIAMLDAADKKLQKKLKKKKA